MDIERRLSVAVRLRPTSQKELAKDHCTIVARALDNRTIHIIDPVDEFNEDVLRKDRNKEKIYTYDHVFNQDAPQHEVFEKTTKPLLDSVIQGFNATVFAYGATGAGKTYTMLGTELNPGIMALTLMELFSKIELDDNKNNGKISVSLSYLEIYNENIRDLLSGRPEYLDLREDPFKGVVVSGISSVVAESANDVLASLHKGNKYRTCESTGANEVVVSHKSTNLKGHTMEKFGKLSMIDLAGSERAAETKNRGIRMIEGASINRSLLALANCINALGTDGKRGKYVNYRDSKLTRLLKGGNCLTVMIANISPASVHFDETHNTLKYAERARNIKTKISQQVTITRVDPYNAAVAQLQNEIGQLKKCLKERADSAATRNNDDVMSVASERQDRRTNAQFVLDELCGTLESLFASHAATQTKLVKCDHDLLHNNTLLKKQRESLAKVHKLLLFENRNDKDDTRQRQWDLIESRVLSNIEQIQTIVKHIGQTKGEVAKQACEMEDRINTMKDNIPATIDPRGRQLLLVYIKSHFLEVDNIAIQTTNDNAHMLLKDRESSIGILLKQVQLLEEITEYQKEVIEMNDLSSPAGLSKLYHEYEHISTAENDKVVIDVKQQLAQPKLLHKKSRSELPKLPVDESPDSSLESIIPSTRHQYQVPTRSRQQTVTKQLLHQQSRTRIELPEVVQDPYQEYESHQPKRVASTKDYKTFQDLSTRRHPTRSEISRQSSSSTISEDFVLTRQKTAAAKAKRKIRFVE